MKGLRVSSGEISGAGDLRTNRRSVTIWATLVSTLLAVSLLLTACAKDPGAEQIKADLIGRVVDVPSVRVAVDEWRFASLSEFQEFYIRNK